MGTRIGWVDSGDLYLQAEAAYACAQKLANEQGEALTVGLGTLRRRLKEKGLLKSTEQRGGQERLEVRRTLEGRRQPVLHLASDSLMGEEVAQVAQVAHSQLISEPPSQAAGPKDLPGISHFSDSPENPGDPWDKDMEDLESGNR